MNQLSHILKQRRQEMNLSLRSAANLIGISHAYLDKLEKGIDSRTGLRNKPTPDTLKLISKTYNIDYMELLACCEYIPYQKSEILPDCNDDVKNLLHIVSKLSCSQIHNLILYAKFLTTNDDQYNL